VASHRRKKKRNREQAVAPARQRKFVPVAATVLAVGVLVAVVYFSVPGRDVEAAKDSAHATPVTETSARASESPPPASRPPAEAAIPTSQTAAVPASGADTTASAPATASNAKRGFDVLKGRWLRPDSDGNYIVQVKSVDASGKMDASYSNPRPIHVSKAEASQDGAAIKVFIELRDVNYPGSTYTLTYDPQSDQLHGIYYQAAFQQRFEVSFVRMKSN
jgi:hypothetical protein